MARDPPQSYTADVAGDRAPQLSGRMEEQRALDDLCDHVKAGHSSAMLIRGEAGVGKTALLHYIARRAASDFRIAEIAGVESEMELAYAGLHQFCLPMLSRLGALPEPQQSAIGVAFGMSGGPAPDRFLVGLATLGLLAETAEKQPLMCLVDDTQWLDDASCQVLSFVARRLAAESVGMIFAIREGLDRGQFVGLSEVRLAGVADADARALLATVVPGRLDERVRDRIVAETRGNPLALLELPRGMTTAELAAGFGFPTADGVEARLEAHYVQQMRGLPLPTQRLMLLAAADAVGDVTTVRRAATKLGIDTDAAALNSGNQLFEIGTRVRFQHPLVRSAVYRAASAKQRQAAHRALAEATDVNAEPDRRAWHRAHATPGPDDEVADELENAAGRAQARGGFAAAAALMERSMSLSLDSVRRVERGLIAAQFHLRAGGFDAALRLLLAADSESTDELTRARIELTRALVAAAADAGGRDVSLQLLRAAKRLEKLDSELARQTYLDAWGAALFAGHLASPGGSVVDVALAARNGPPAEGARSPFDHLLDGLAVLSTDGRAAGEPVIRDALHALRAFDLPAEAWLHWGPLAQIAAVLIWDLETWSAVGEYQVKLARDLGALAVLPTAMHGLSILATWRGDFETAEARAAELDAVQDAVGARIAPYGRMILSAYQGRIDEASALIARTGADSLARGEGLGVDLARYSGAVLNNSLGRYPEAMELASPASAENPGLVISTWMLSERVEAAVRCGERKVAASALAELERAARPGNSEWGLGIEARSRAMLSEESIADVLYREAIERLDRTPLRAEVARSHLVYGEWLRRSNRRVDARVQLKTAHGMFVEMTADGFAERARRELLATGEHVRARGVSGGGELTAQEEHIARMARDGRTNPEIGSELYLSPRTVEWHLGKVFTKLGITSRRGLADALPRPRQANGST